ncbi:hypothetical protein VYU27_000503 [Nannochloropsis oceanica]
MAPILLACYMSGAGAVAAAGGMTARYTRVFVRPLGSNPAAATRRAASHQQTRHMMMASASSVAEGKQLDARVHTGHHKNNVPVALSEKIGRELHRNPSHPLGIIKDRIEGYFRERAATTGVAVEIVDNFFPVVSIVNNFDDLLIPPDHVSRSPIDTYYVDDQQVLRTHTSAHQSTMLGKGYEAFLVTGDVYRRDEIDRTHYPVFHQMEGVRVFPGLLEKSGSREEGVKMVEKDLKDALEGMVMALFGDVERRWVDTYFPFTDPSFELEIFYNDEWLEVLGCGVMQQEIVRKAGKGETLGWAFGLGLERLAMVLFQIPDIRLFWSTDKRFTDQFSAGKISKFSPFSKYPPCYKDVSFWVDPVAGFNNNDFFEIVRGVGGDLVESVVLVDEFVHPKTGRGSKCFRVNYRSMERSLTNDEIDVLQEEVRKQMAEALKVELR